MDTVVARGTEQTQEYMQRSGATLGHLVVFDPDPARDWSDKVYQKPLADSLTLWGC
jgi:hypothetical protein